MTSSAGKLESATATKESETRQGSGSCPAHSRIQARTKKLRQQRCEKVYKIMFKPAVTEFIFTFFHLLLGIMVGAGPNLTGTGPFSLTAAALATGLNLYAFISTTFDISGGHLNPIISYGVFLVGGIALDQTVIYIVVQLLAGTAAAGVAKALINDTELPDHWALIKFNDKLQNETQAIFTEALLCCALLLVAYLTIVETHGKNPFGPLLIGVFVAACIYTAGPLSGAGINPARCFGPVVVFGGWSTVWIYVVGPFAGTTVAAIIYRLFLSKKRVPNPKLSALRHIWKYREGPPEVVIEFETTV